MRIAYAWVLLVFIFANSSVAIAAVGTTGAETWYVRPTGACTFNGDGLAYGCADSNGASGAFSSFANVIWTVTTGVDDGDILYVCGNHFTELIVGASGGSLAAPITIRGSCPSDPGSIDTSGQTPSSPIDAIEITDRTYITVEQFGTATRPQFGPAVVSHIGIRGSVRNGILAFAGNGSTRDGIIVQDNVVDNRNANNTSNVCHAIYFLNSGTGRHTNSRISRNVVLGTGTNCASQSNNDGISVHSAGTGMVVEYNYTTGSNDGVDTSSGDSGLIVRGNRAYGNRVSGLKIHGGIACPVGIKVYGNVSWGNGNFGIVFQDAQNSTFANNTVIHVGPSNDLREAFNYALVNGCTHTGNTIVNNVFIGNYNLGIARVNTDNRAAFEANTVNGNIWYQTSSQNPILQFDADSGNNVTSSNFSTWQASHAKDLISNPLLAHIGSGDGRMSASSPARRGGVWWGNDCTDVRGRPCWIPPDIGGYQITRDDVPDLRSNASQRAQAALRNARN